MLSCCDCCDCCDPGNETNSRLAKSAGIRDHKMADVKKEVLRAGSGSPPKKGDTIEVHCTGSLNTNPPKKFWRYVFSNDY